MSDKEFIEQVLGMHGLTAIGWDDQEDGLVALLGDWEATEDDEQEMYFAGDVGPLKAEIVGSEQYGNKQVHFSFTPEDCDSGWEVRNLSNFEYVDA